ncbi:MAG: DNA polymerase III subunit delta' [Pseudomonadota bacterium]
MLTHYPWQASQWQHFMTMHTQHRLPHALLLTGNAGLGLHEFAKQIARHLLCFNTADECNPDESSQSYRLFDTGNHPDYRSIEPEEIGKQIKVTQIRELIEFLSLKSFTTKNKIVTLSPAEAMNRSTANALLKTLEEPPEQSMLILISHHPERLPITIRSRCQKIEFQPAYDQQAINWLEEQKIESAYSSELLLQLTGGAPLAVIEMLENEMLDERQQIVADIDLILQDRANPVELASRWESLGCDLVIVWLMRFCQDIVRLKLMHDGADIVNQDLSEGLLEIAKSLDIARIMRIYGFLQQKYREATAQTNFNSLSLLEEIIIYWNNPKQVKQF